MSVDDGTADFGFERVPADEKAARVKGVFDRVADRYDLMNDLMSGGMHRLWKSAFLDRIHPRAGERLIDVAGGTGDIARGFLARADSRPTAAKTPPAEAIVCDVNHAMLAAGRSDAQGRLVRVCGDAERLPFPDRSADVVTIAFGIRNVTRRAAALAEMFRVLRIGGRFACLEFSRPTTAFLEGLYDAYSFNVIPRLGAAVVGDRASYQYLVESIRRFPPQDVFADEIAAAGFRRVAYDNHAGGVVAAHYGWKA
ncbi:MAG: class I SAM-dependent methyltransferase [Parvularculaceae bacterium]|nr:class I SAM-dependent methyltransferase [Parvularculaceae bacterium]